MSRRDSWDAIIPAVIARGAPGGPGEPDPVLLEAAGMFASGHGEQIIDGIRKGMAKAQAEKEEQ